MSRRSRCYLTGAFIIPPGQLWHLSSPDHPFHLVQVDLGVPGWSTNVPAYYPSVSTHFDGVMVVLDLPCLVVRSSQSTSQATSLPASITAISLHFYLAREVVYHPLHGHHHPVYHLYYHQVEELQSYQPGNWSTETVQSAPLSDQWLDQFLHPHHLA